MEKTKDPSWEAFEKCRECREEKITQEEARKEIEKGIGDVAFAAFRMCENGYASKDWAIEQIKRGIGDVAYAAYYMLCHNYVSKDWAIKQIEKGIGEVDLASSLMCIDGYASKEWRNELLNRLNRKEVITMTDSKKNVFKLKDKVKLNVYVEKDIKNKALKKAESLGEPLSVIIRRLIKGWVNNETN